jgi:Secretion system C-terminal sorting domain
MKTKLFFLIFLMQSVAQAQTTFVQKLLGQRRDKFIGNNWVGQDSITWQYNAAGDSTNKTSNQFSNSTWNPLQNNIFEYNAAGLQTKYTRQSWLNNAWQNGTRFLYSYDSNYNEILTEKQIWNVGSAAWQPSQKIIKTYTATNKISSEELFLFSNNMYTPYSISLFTYGANDLVSLIENKVWDNATNVYTNVKKRDYAWTFSGKITVFNEYNWSTIINQYQYANQIFYYYDIAENLVDVIAKKDSTLVRDYRITNHFTTTNVIDTSITFKGDTNNVISWVATKQFTYIYNPDSSLNELKIFTPNGFSWQLDSSAVYTYNANKNITSINHQKLISGAFAQVQQSNYQYNNLYNKTYYLLQDKSGNNYFNNSQTFYYYNQNPLAVNNVGKNNFILKAFPNPCRDYLKITTTHTGIFTVAIYNTLGQIMQTTTTHAQGNTISIPTANLPIGNYYLSMQADNTAATLSFSKQ